LWSNAFSFGWASPSTGLSSWVALRCLYCLCFLNCTKFRKFILTKIIKIVATRRHISRLKCTKYDFGWGSAPDHTGVASPDSLAGGEESWLAPPQELHSRSRLFGTRYSASILGHSGLDTSSPGHNGFPRIQGC